MQKIAARHARTPDPDAAGAVNLGLMYPRHQAGSDVAVEMVEVVARPVEVRRHRGDEIAAMLKAIRLTQLDAGDLGDRVPFVRRLQRPGQQRAFGQRLRCQFRVDAGRSEIQQLGNAAALGGMDDVGCDRQIVIDEVSGLGRKFAKMPPTGRPPAPRHRAGWHPSSPRPAIVGADRVHPGRTVRISPPSRISRRTTAEPTMPACPATQTRRPVGSKKFRMGSLPDATEIS